MDFELDDLIKCFTTSSFKVKGVYRFKVAAGKKGRQKTAPYPGFILPLGGKGQFGFNGTSYITDTQKIIHGGSDMILDKEVLGNSELSYISVIYDINQKTRDIFLPEAHFELTVGQSPRLKGLLHRLWKAFYEPGAMAAFQVETLFHCSLEEIFVGANSQLLDSDKKLFTKICYYIHENYGDELTVSELAEMFEMNTNGLYYLFVKYAGMGPGDYLISYRLNRAKELLLATDVLIHQVASEVGYADPLYFSRTFKKRFGCSPSEIRKKIHE